MNIEKEIIKVRKILWKEFDEIIPDETVKLMVYSFKMMAKIIIRNLENEHQTKKETKSG